MKSVTISISLDENPVGFIACNVCDEIVSIGAPMTWEDIQKKAEEIREHKH